MNTELGTASANDANFTGSIADLYDRYLVPRLFAPYAEDLATRLGDLREGAVLEIAAGTGAVTQALAIALPPNIRLVATDLNDAMLSVGKRRVTRPSLVWERADAQQLPFGNDEFDIVVCQFGIMFVPDKVRAFREARRVLRRTGRFIFSVWDKLEFNEVSQVVDRAVAAIFTNDPPRFFERTPFGYNDPVTLRQQLTEAGFAQITIEPVEKVTQAGSARDVAIGLCHGTPLRSEIEARGGALDVITDRVTDAVAARFGSASFDNRMRALVVTASQV